MIANCGIEFYEKHMERYRRMPLSDVLKEYESIIAVLDMDCSSELMCLDELLTWEDMIRDYCLELVQNFVETVQGEQTCLCSGALWADMFAKAQCNGDNKDVSR